MTDMTKKSLTALDHELEFEHPFLGEFHDASVMQDMNPRSEAGAYSIGMDRPVDDVSKVSSNVRSEITMEAACTLDWLISDVWNRGTGRTQALAEAFLRKAIRCRGQWVWVFDHFPPSVNSIKELTDRIRMLASKQYLDLAVSLTGDKGSVKVL